MDKHMTVDQVRERIVFVAHSDGRYAPGAFFFVNEVVGKAVEWLQSGEMEPIDADATRDADGANFHISGAELLEALRRLARDRWGCLARQVLESWGVARTEDVGEIVFLMVNDEKLEWKRRDSDTPEDFAGGFDFREAFDPWESR